MISAFVRQAAILPDFPSRLGAGCGGRFDWRFALAGLAAFVALFRHKAGIIAVILACGAAGLADTLTV